MQNNSFFPQKERKVTRVIDIFTVVIAAAARKLMMAFCATNKACFE